MKDKADPKVGSSQGWLVGPMAGVTQTVISGPIRTFEDTAIPVGFTCQEQYYGYGLYHVHKNMITGQ